MRVLASVRSLLLIATLVFAAESKAAVLVSGTLSADGDVFSLALHVNSAGTIDVQSLGYGGWTPLSIGAGGFATGLALYDSLGNQVALDFTGGTWTGSTCSNGAQQDPTTGACEDAFLSFVTAGPGDYTLFLTTQVNTAPSIITDPFLLATGESLSPGPFSDPGFAPGTFFRTGDWAIQVTLDGTVGEVPEPGSIAMAAIGLAALSGWRLRRRRIQTSKS